MTSAGEPATPEEIAGRADLPLFRVRSSLRELVQAGLIEEKENKYRTTERGREALQRSPSS